MAQIMFSVVLPVRNGGHYIKTCVKSLLNQTYSNFNLIVLENCSTDGTAEWLSTLNDNRIIVYEAPKPLSIEENWARIIEVERNEFMLLTGHDDVFETHYLETIVHLIHTHPKASLYLTHFNFINAQGKVLRHCKPMDEKQYGFEFLASLLTNQTDLMGTGFVMRSKDYDAVGGIPPAYPNLLFSDLILFYELSKLSYKATALQSCFSFRIHQSTTTLSADLKFQTAFRQVIYYLANIRNTSTELQAVISRYSLDFIVFYCKGLAHRMMRSYTRNQQLSVKQFVNDCNTYAKLLSPEKPFDANTTFSIKLARMIDSNILSRSLFLLFKKLYKKPVL